MFKNNFDLDMLVLCAVLGPVDQRNMGISTLIYFSDLTLRCGYYSNAATAIGSNLRMEFLTSAHQGLLTLLE